jgi:hypothetical protein
MIKEFFEFCKQKYLLFAMKDKIKDGRKSPQVKVKATAIFLSFFLLVIFKRRSILQLDQLMRLKGVRNFFNTTPDRKLVASDSTIARSLSSFEIQPLRSYLKRIYLKSKLEGSNRC